MAGECYCISIRKAARRVTSIYDDALAPATEGPVVNPGPKRSGRLVFGDANE